MNPLTPRRLGRTERLAPPLIWLIHPQVQQEVWTLAAAAGANWAIVPASLTDQSLGSLAVGRQHVSIILGLDAASLASRKLDGPSKRLQLLGQNRCLAGLIQDIAADEVKAGWPFHRLGQLRDRGLMELLMAQADDCAAGEWLVDHSPAQAVVAPYTIANQLAAYRLLDSASEVDTAILAQGDGGDPAADVRFVLSDPRIAAVVLPLPHTPAELGVLLEAASNPMDESDRQKLWADYQTRVPAPPKPRSAHPPE